MERSDGFTIQIMNQLRLRSRSQGLTQEVLAQRMQVSHPTLKRWFAGRGVSLRTVKKLCDALGITLFDVVSSVEKVAPAQITYSLSQEEFLAQNPACLAFFDYLLQGHTPASIGRRFRIEKTQIERFLSQLEKISLIDWLPHNKARCKVTGEPVWRKNGPLAQRFRAEILADFCNIGDPMPLSLYELLADDIPQISAEVSALDRSLRQAHARAQTDPDCSRSYGAIIAIRPFRWSLDSYLRKQ